MSEKEHSNVTPIKKGRRRLGCWLGCSGIVLLVGVLGVIAVAGGYFLVQSGQLSIPALSALLPVRLGGEASIELSNLTETTVAVTLERLNLPEDTQDILERTLLDYEIDTFRNIQPASYRLVVDASSGGPGTYSCTLTIRGGTTYYLIVLDQGVAFAYDNQPAEQPSDLILESSPLCE